MVLTLMNIHRVAIPHGSVILAFAFPLRILFFGYVKMIGDKRDLKKTDGGMPCIAASSYLNTAPLIWSYIYGSRQRDARLLTDTSPAACGDMLGKGLADIALVPVIEYQRDSSLLVVPNVCVGSRSGVRSVVIATHYPDLKDVRTIGLDTSSRTSSVLIQIIFREFLAIEPVCTTYLPDVRAMLKTSDAALVIGDPAMTFPRDDLYVHDLASLWHEYTGLGFVFAMWMARKGSREVVRSVDLAGARDEGIANFRDIVERYHAALGLPREELLSYLTNNITFKMDDDMSKGLELYFKLAHKHGFIASSRPLRMI
jgi:chorismate dehydratase